MPSVAIALVGIAIALLAVYGADVAASQSGSGFLPLSEAERGMGLGIPSLVLPFAAYAVGRKSKSALLGGMLVAAGVLVMAGGAAVLGADSPDRDPASAAGMLFGGGAAHAALGALVLRSSKG